ncbi:putative metal-dependent RNase [Thauera sp. 28]|nr:putative metal-dependent RNase [Thauera sp. 28]
MGGVPQRVVLGRPDAGLDLADLVADRDHRGCEALEFIEAFGLGRLDHDRTRHREGHGRRVEAVVHQALGDVDLGDAGRGLDRPDVEDAFMRDAALAAGVEHRVVVLEALGEVVGVEDRYLGRALEALSAHHRDVHPRDRQDAGGAEWRGRDCALAQVGTVSAARGLHHVVGHEGREVCGEADRPHARTAAAVRDAEGLVQVHVRHVGTDRCRGGKADLGVEVGAVHVHLATMGMDDGADLADRFLEHAVRGRVGDHQRCQLGSVLFGLGLEVGDVHVAVVVAFDHHHLHAAHLRGGRVGAVGRLGNQAHVAMRLAAAGVIARDRHQAGVLALRARVGLHADRREAGDGTQVVGQALDHLEVAGSLFAGCERVQVGECRPGHRDHLAGGVELHRARAERDHRVIERKVAVLQLLEVAQHLVLGVVRVEYRMRQDGVGAQHLGGQVAAALGETGVERREVGVEAEALEHADEVVAGGCFIHGQPESRARSDMQVVAGICGCSGDGRRACACIDLDGVEEGVGIDGEAALAQRCGEQCRQAMDACCDRAQALRTVIHGIETRHVGEQDLRGADVGVGLLAPDVLLARLQRHAQRGLAAGVLRDTDDAARHRAHEGFAGGEEGRVRAAETHRYAEALRRAECDVCAHCPRALEQDQRHEVAGHRDDCALRLECGDRGRQVDHLAACVGVLQQGAKGVVCGGFLRLAEHQLVTEVVRTCAHHVDGLREAGFVDEEDVRLGLRHPARHGHCFRGSCGLVEQGRIGKLQPGEIDHHLLVVEQCLQAALGDLGLVGCVRGVPARVFHHVAQDHCRRVGAVVALTDQGLPDHVVGSDGLEPGERFMLGDCGRQRERLRQADAGGDGLRDQRVDVTHADRRAHAGDLLGIGADVATDEGVALLQCSERGGKQGVGHGQAWAISAS